MAPTAPVWSRECIPTSTFSSTVMLPKRRMFWKVRAIPRAVIWWGCRRWMGGPSKKISPEVGA